VKYVILSKVEGSLLRKVPIIFPNALVHADVAGAVLKTLPEGYSVFSAGEITLDVLACSGKSDTLKVKSHIGDRQTIDMIDYMHGIEDVDGGEAPQDQVSRMLATDSIRRVNEALNRLTQSLDKLGKPPRKRKRAP
jgi:hypothetical protein